MLSWSGASSLRPAETGRRPEDVPHAARRVELGRSWEGSSASSTRTSVMPQRQSPSFKRLPGPSPIRGRPSVVAQPPAAFGAFTLEHEPDAILQRDGQLLATHAAVYEPGAASTVSPAKMLSDVLADGGMASLDAVSADFSLAVWDPYGKRSPWRVTRLDSDHSSTHHSGPGLRSPAIRTCSSHSARRVTRTRGHHSLPAEPIARASDSVPRHPQGTWRPLGRAAPELLAEAKPLVPAGEDPGALPLAGGGV